MKSIFEEMGGTYRQVGDYFIPTLSLPDESEYQIGKYGRMRRNYLKEHRKILYNYYVLEGMLFKHLAEIDQACHERMEILVSAMAKQEGVTEALKAADQMEWIRCMNSIRNRTEEIILIELAGRKILCKRFSTKSRMALESRADSGLNPLITESHGGQNGMRAGTA